MKKKLDNFIHSRFFVIILIFVLIVTTALVGTYAWFTWSNPSDENTIFTMSIGGIVDVSFSEGNAISGTLEPVYNYYDGLSTSFDANNRSGAAISYNIIFNISSIDNELISDDVKYVVLINKEVVSEGDFSGASNDGMLTLYSGVLSTGFSNCQVYFYIDGNVENDISMMNHSISGNIMIEANNMRLTEYITTLYLNNKDSVVTNNGIEYNYATAELLMNDRLGGTTEDYDAGNIRYYGGAPNNYVDIGDRDSSGNVILYRIIGIFKNMEVVDDDGTIDNQDLIKVIRADSIGTYAWDNKTNGIGSSLSANGSGNWTDARLMMLLNPGYDGYSSTNPLLDSKGNTLYGYKGSLWWNSESGTCYAGSSNATKACNFTSTGLSKNVQSKIKKVIWSLSNDALVSVYSDKIYSAERNEATGGNLATEWIGKVALMYASDYGYAADFTKCNAKLNGYNTEVCTTNDWLYTNKNQWTLSAFSSNSNYVTPVMGEGRITAFNAFNAIIIRPSFYLDSELVINVGNGSKENPYVLG